MSIDNEFLERVYDKQESMSKDVSDIKVILAKQEENLKLHIYRTDLAEENIELLREQIKPIETHVKSINGVLKALGVFSLLAGLIVSVLEIFKRYF